ncbi:glycosyltransferase family A protein [Apibacter sp. HY039]|uniref:glycosyltransferase family 2 protein n=1 Tax=Apibacter sp. HY039 TaxID=2501476 RepID=UPI000FEBA22F|nr:glycosyltransferase family A protein [Apibacter sp. HY039]
MKLVVVVPVYNEAKFLRECLESFANQSYKNITWIIVNDASTDESPEIIQNFIQDKPEFLFVNLTHKSEHKPGAKVVRTFYKGLNSVNYKDFDVIAKLDADIILPPDYYETMITELENNPKIGMVGGLVYVEKNGIWNHETIASKNHIRGAVKTYRKECFEDIGGLRETLGWDNLDVLLSRMKGWDVKVVKNIWVKLLKPTAHVYKDTKALKLGKYFYNIGLDPALSFISCAKAAWNDRSVSNFFISYQSYISMVINKEERKITPDEISFIRKYRWKEVLNKFGI